jgi:hypothetical protein
MLWLWPLALIELLLPETQVNVTFTGTRTMGELALFV